jgi:hypothetical protein
MADRRQPKPRDDCETLRQCFGDAVVAGKGGVAAGDRERIGTAGGARIQCSLNLDALLREEYPNEHRWDYLLIVGNGTPSAIGVEVHAATAGEVNVILVKRARAMAIIKARCVGLAVSRWYWVASGKVFLRATDPQFRVLRRSGVLGPARRVVLSADGSDGS